jgi:hypothetical protein
MTIKIINCAELLTIIWPVINIMYKIHYSITKKTIEEVKTPKPTRQKINYIL